jgi:hypothetical protein
MGKLNVFTFLQIPDYSAQSSRNFFEKDKDITAKVATDKWKCYNPIAKDHDLTQRLSDKGSKFKRITRNYSSGEIISKRILFVGK